ncbi:MAG: ACP S-malonyltransferase [Thermonemataceae bacterium]
MKAYVFPGQGAQFSGMGKELYESNDEAKKLFEQANDILGFRITDLMFEGSEEDLKQTKVTQPAVFLHSVILALTTTNVKPDMVAGHSLGEFSALVANQTLAFEDALGLVAKRAAAMQQACEKNPSTMAAIINLADAVVEEICKKVTEESPEELVVPANYNSPGQIVISGTVQGINTACEHMKAAGAKRAIVLSVGGAFHSPLMAPAHGELKEAIEAINFKTPICPIYQNVNAQSTSDPATIQENLIAQLTSPVRWAHSIEHMIADGAVEFIESGPGKVLQGLVRKINPSVTTKGI